MKSLNIHVLLLFAAFCSVAVQSTHAYQRSVTKATRRPKLAAWEDDLANGLAPPRQRRRFLPKLLRKENRWEVVELVRVLRGGASVESGDETRREMNGLDRSLRSISFWLGGIVAGQAIATLVDHNDNLLHEIADRLLSPESATAVKMIRRIIEQFEDHGVIDIFKEYAAKDVVGAIVALGKLQSAAAYSDDQKEHTGADIDPKLLQQLAHYSVYATAAYGWTMEVAFRGRLHMGNLRALLQKTGIQADDVVAAFWESKTHRPAYFIVRDKTHKKLVLAIRGTLSARDVLTDLCATAETFETGCKRKHRAHHGMLEAARGVAKETEDVVNAELKANPDYSLVLVGHSMGGGVAAVLGTLWETEYPNLVVYSYGSPCVGPIDARPTTCENIISVLGEGDPFSCLSLGHIADVSKALALLCEDEELRSSIRMRTEGAVDKMDPQDLQWCADTMGKLRESLTAERMYPPGRTLFVKRGADSIVSLREVSRARFTDLRLHPRMLDVSRHVPSLYESLLQEIVSE